MGDTLDILSGFTTHSSICLFTSRYVRSVCVSVICISVCPCLCVYPHILCVRSCMMVRDHVNVYVCTWGLCVCLGPCMCFLAASYLTSCLSWTLADCLLFYQTKPEPEQERKHLSAFPHILSPLMKTRSY